LSFCGKNFIYFFRLPFPSNWQTFPILSLRAAVSFASFIHSIKFLRSFELSVFHWVLAFESVPSALYRGMGTTAKQQMRLFPDASRDGMLEMRFLRVSACFASSIHKMKSLRARGVSVFHVVFAEVSAASTLRKSVGTWTSFAVVRFPLLIVGITESERSTFYYFLLPRVKKVRLNVAKLVPLRFA